MNVVMGALVFWWSLDGQSVLRGGKTEQKRFSADCSVDRMNNVKPGCRPAADSAVFYAPPLGVSKLRSSQSCPVMLMQCRQGGGGGCAQAVPVFKCHTQRNPIQG